MLKNLTMRCKKTYRYQTAMELKTAKSFSKISSQKKAINKFSKPFKFLSSKILQKSLNYAKSIDSYFLHPVALFN